MNKELWNQLYSSIDHFIELEPWEYLYGEEMIHVYDEKECKDYYCSIMGKQKECIALSMYQGQDGLADLFSLFNNYPDEEIVKYIMYDQSNLTFYLGQKEEVPIDQLEIMKLLNKKYKKNNYPYFLSFKPHYYPFTPNNDEIKIMIKIINHLSDTITKLINDEIDVELENEEIIYTTLYSKEYSSIAFPEYIDKYQPIILYDEIIDEAKQYKRSNQSFIFDLKYLNAFIEDDEFERPAQTLLFMIYNESTDHVYYFDVLEPDIDEIELLLSAFLQLFESQGIPETIYFRMPKVYQACAHFAHELNFHLDYMELDFLDDLYDVIYTTAMEGE